MNDTTPEIQARYHAMIMAKSPQERLLMQGGMWETGKRLLMSALLAENPGISKLELKRKFVARMYRDDLPPETMEKVLAWLH